MADQLERRGVVRARARPARRHHRVLVPEQQRVDAAEIAQLRHPRAQRLQLGWGCAHEPASVVDVVEQLAGVGERVVLGEVALGLLARRAAEGHVERDEPRGLLVVDARRRRRAPRLDLGSGSRLRLGALGRRLRLSSSAGPTSTTSRSSARSSADRRPASSRRRPISAPSSSSSAPIRSSSSRAAVETRWTCCARLLARLGAQLLRRRLGRLDDPLDLRRRRRRDRLRGGAVHALDLVGELAQVRVDRARARSRGGRSGNRSAGWRSGRGPRRDATR